MKLSEEAQKRIGQGAVLAGGRHAGRARCPDGGNVVRPVEAAGAHKTSSSLRVWLRSQTERPLLGFSRGKDAVAAFQALRESDMEPECVHFALVPDLEFVEVSLRQFEQAWGLT